MKSTLTKVNIIFFILIISSFAGSKELSIGNIKILAKKELYYEIEKGIIYAEDGITIEKENTRVEGKTLVFYEKTKSAEITGSPVKIESEDVTINVDNVKISFQTDDISATGNIYVNYENTVLNSNKISFNLKNEKGIAEGNVKLIHKFPKEQKFQIAGQENKPTEIKTEKITLTSDNIEFDRKKNWALVTGKPRIDIDEGYITSEQFECDFEKKEITGKGTILISIKDININGNELILKYQDKIAFIKNAKCEYKSNKMTGQMLELLYSEDKHIIRVKENATVDIKVEEETKK